FFDAPDVWPLTGSGMSATATITHAAAAATANHRWIIANSPALLLVARSLDKNSGTLSQSAVGCNRMQGGEEPQSCSLKTSINRQVDVRATVSAAALVRFRSSNAPC